MKIQEDKISEVNCLFLQAKLAVYIDGVKVKKRNILLWIFVSFR